MKGLIKNKGSRFIIDSDAGINHHFYYHDDKCISAYFLYKRMQGGLKYCCFSELPKLLYQTELLYLKHNCQILGTNLIPQRYTIIDQDNEMQMSKFSMNPLLHLI